MTDEVKVEQDRYLIRKGGAYYRPNAQGYTRNKAEAGRYTLAEAIRHSHPNGPDGPRDGIDFLLDDEPNMVEELVRTIEEAGRGYSINLTRLVDGEATYTLKYRGDVTEHASHEDALEHLRELTTAEKRKAARHALAARPAPAEDAVTAVIRNVLYRSKLNGCSADVYDTADEIVAALAAMQPRGEQLAGRDG